MKIRHGIRKLNILKVESSVKFRHGRKFVSTGSSQGSMQASTLGGITERNIMKPRADGKAALRQDAAKSEQRLLPSSLVLAKKSLFVLTLQYRCYHRTVTESLIPFRQPGAAELATGSRLSTKQVATQILLSPLNSLHLSHLRHKPNLLAHF